MLRFALTLCLLLMSSAVCRAAGMASSTNFVVFAPSEEVAEQVLEAAESYRQQIAQTLLGKALPPGVGRTILHVEFSPEESGRTWAIDRSDRKMHSVWIRAEPRQVTAAPLGHEIVHVVLATRYPHPKRLPIWLEEGFACQWDDSQRNELRRGVLEWFAETGNWPRAADILARQEMPAGDTSAYAVATSLTDFLLTKGDFATLFAFAQAAQIEGSAAALKTHYAINSESELQELWQNYVSSTSSR